LTSHIAGQKIDPRPVHVAFVVVKVAVGQVLNEYLGFLDRIYSLAAG
jgi:hypothetical protein